MERLIILVDLGRVRVIKFRPAGESPVEREHLFNDESESAEQHVVSRGEIVTDQSGRFGHRGMVGVEGGMSYGEQHNLESELERRALKRVAGKIAEVLQQEDNPPWVLAAPQPILRRLEAALPPACRRGLADSVGADLCKEPIAKVEERFRVGR